MQARLKRSTPASLSTPAIALALVLLALLGAGGAAVVQTIRMVPGAAVPGQYVVQSRQRTARAAATPAQAKPLFAGPGWGLMTRGQKLALYPLAERWDYMTEAQKRRWLALADTFGGMPEEEQRRLHERMVAWAGLTAQQRSQARLTFATARALSESESDIQTQWEAYQALSEEQKHRLAASAPKPRGAATALRPVPSKRLAHVPTPTYAQSQSANPPKIVLPATIAVRVPTPPAPVELAPNPVPLAPPADELPSDTSRDSAEQEDVRASDPLPELYVN